MALSFVADENVESDVVVALRGLGHDVVDVAHSSPGAAGYAHRLRRTLGRHHRPGDAQLLDRSHGLALSGHLVGLVAAITVGSVYRRPAGKSRGGSSFPV